MTANWYLFDESFLTADFPVPLSGEPENSFYEVLRVQNGIPLFLEDHTSRFLNSCRLKGITFPHSMKYLRRLILQLIWKNEINTGNIKFEFFLCPKINHLLIRFIPHFYPSTLEYESGVHLACYQIERPDPHVKQSSVNNAVRIEINKKLSESKAYEILLINHKQEITEGSKSNLFFIRGNELVSPPAELILEGITRKKVIEIANRLAVRYTERVILYNELSDYDAVFLTGTSPKILPVKSIDSYSFTMHNQLIGKLMVAYDNMIDDYCRLAGQ